MIVVIIAEPGETGCQIDLAAWKGTGTPAASYAMTEVSDGVYESADIAGLVGEFRVRMVNAASSVVYIGYVNFDGGTHGQAEEYPYSATLARIEAKTTLLGSGQVAVVAIVTPTGEIASPIILGDDYLEANGRAFQWIIPAVPGIAVGSAQFYFGGRPITGGNGWVVMGEVADVGSGNWSVSAELPRTATANLGEGLYRWSGEVRDQNGNEVTRIRSDSNRHVQLVAKQT